jgi:hypothetical protein
VNALELIDGVDRVVLLASSSYDGVVSVWRLDEKQPAAMFVTSICAHYDDGVSALAR